MLLFIRQKLLQRLRLGCVALVSATPIGLISSCRATFVLIMGRLCYLFNALWCWFYLRQHVPTDRVIFKMVYWLRSQFCTKVNSPSNSSIHSLDTPLKNSNIEKKLNQWTYTIGYYKVTRADSEVFLLLKLTLLSILLITACPTFAEETTDGTRNKKVTGGWHWYDDPKLKDKKKKIVQPKPVPPPPAQQQKPETITIDTKWLRDNLPKLHDKAQDNPSRANISAYVQCFV